MKRVLVGVVLLMGCGRSGLFPGVGFHAGDAGPPTVEVNVVEDRSCPADVSAAMGKPCPTEGVHCGSCSKSPCQWCNLLACADHRWQNIEAFPAPDSYCDFPCGPSGVCDRFTEVCVQHLARDTACKEQFTCAPLPKGCVNCEALDGGGQLLISGCGT